MGGRRRAAAGAAPGTSESRSRRAGEAPARRRRRRGSAPRPCTPFRRSARGCTCAGPPEPAAAPRRRARRPRALARSHATRSRTRRRVILTPSCPRGSLSRSRLGAGEAAARQRPRPRRTELRIAKEGKMKYKCQVSVLCEESRGLPSMLMQEIEWIERKMSAAHALRRGGSCFTLRRRPPIDIPRPSTPRASAASASSPGHKGHSRAAAEAPWPPVSAARGGRAAKLEEGDASRPQAPLQEDVGQLPRRRFIRNVPHLHVVEPHAGSPRPRRVRGRHHLWVGVGGRHLSGSLSRLAVLL